MSEFGLNAQQPTSLEGHNIESPTEFTFNLQVANAMQEAARYNSARGCFLILAGVAAYVAFFTEMRSYAVFNDWLSSHEWTDHGMLRSFVEWLVGAFPLYFLVPAIFGIASLFMNDDFAKICRTVFLSLAIPMLLLPAFRGESMRLLQIGAFVCIYFVCRILARWAGDQRPRDWKTILAEKKRLGWGLKEFALALTHGRASDGCYLVVIVQSGEPFPWVEGVQEKVDNLLKQEAYAQLQAVLPPNYTPLTTLLRLTIKQRFPRALKPLELLERDVSPEERQVLTETVLYVHPEIADRAKSLIGD